MGRIVKGRPHVVIVGGGFAGLNAARAFRGKPGHVTLIDKSNHHLFQPLLYQIAMAGLSAGDIASPIRTVLAGQKNASVLLDEVVTIDLKYRNVHTREHDVPYDFLILATGAETNYFGNDEWAKYAPGLKSLDDALEIRQRLLLAFEAAEHEFDPHRRRELLTFVVIGGGPTGVELAGAIAELSRYVLSKDYQSIHHSSTRVVLLQAAPQILPMLPPNLSQKAVRQLSELGVEVHTGKMVTKIDDKGVYLGDVFIPSVNVIWAAGVKPTGLGKTLGVELDRGGRVVVEPDLSIPGYPEAFAIGDMACFQHTPNGKPLPGVSAVAIQQGRAAAASIMATMQGRQRKPFRYFDKGTMATIGRSRAVAHAFGVKMSGFFAWAAWLLVHVWFLVGFRNRFAVLFNWAWSYVTYQRGARLITGHRREPGTPNLQDLTMRIDVEASKAGEIIRPREQVRNNDGRATDVVIAARPPKAPLPRVRTKANGVTRTSASVIQAAPIGK